MLGATPAVGNLSRVTANLAAGGRTTVSALAYASTLLLVVSLAGQYLALIPQTVTAGIVIYFAAGMVDDGARRIIGQLFVQRQRIERQAYRTLFQDFSVILLVAFVAVFGDMIKAVGIGVGAAMFLFVTNRMRPVIRRVSFGDTHRSLKVRNPEDTKWLAASGSRIAIIEVDGPLFFGTADSIEQKVAALPVDCNIIIIDLRRVHDIDPTGARKLLQITRRLHAKQRELLLTGTSDYFRRFLQTMGLDGVLPADKWHDDLDHALQHVEDALLETQGGSSQHRVLRLSETALASGLDPQQVLVLEKYLRQHECVSGTQLFAKGDTGDSLYVTSTGSVDILVPLNDNRTKRIVSLGAGVIFGEMALLQGEVRSTTAVLWGTGIVWELTRVALDQLLNHDPPIARQVLFNVGCQLASRLRGMTTEFLALENDA